ncbi:MAG: gamma-glutamyltransferase, partial [Nitrospirae bacterium]
MKRQKNNEYDFKEPGRKRFYRPQKFAASRLGMAATQHYHATEAAIEILKKGGNAIDAAVSAAFALSVCEPTASGLGGQTMILIYLSGSNKKIAIDGSSRAPHRVVPGKYSRKDLFTGHKATTVPSTPAVLCYVLKTYGTMSLREVLEPAIRLAEEGYRITQLQHDLMVRELKRLRGGSAGRLFLIDGKKAYPVGTLFRQPVLARTLKTIAEKGIEEFYLGEIGRKIEKDMIENGGLIRYDDLAQIPWPVERTPLSTRFRDMRIITMGPPGAGRALIEALHIIENIPEDLLDLDTPDGVIALVEVIRQVNIDRRDRPVDPNIYHQLPARLMLRRDYAKEVARCITSFIKTGGETTHLSVADSKGNMVALTQSIERVFGSCEA